MLKPTEKENKNLRNHKVRKLNSNGTDKQQLTNWLFRYKYQNFFIIFLMTSISKKLTGNLPGKLLGNLPGKLLGKISNVCYN